MVRIIGNKFETDVYSKPTDCRHFLEFCLKIVYREGSLIKRLYSSSLAFEKYLESIRSWFGKSCFPEKLVDNQLRRTVKKKTNKKKTKKKTRQSSYLNIKQNIELVYHIWLHTIFGFMI